MSQSVDHDQARAVAFVRAHGTASERSRLRILLEGTRPTAEEEAAILAGQRADGGWAPFWATDYSSVDATCFRLAQAEQSGIPPEHEAIQRGVHFLRDRQRDDGSWEEVVVMADVAPPWAKPGDLAARLYLTANSAYWLAKHLPQNAAAIRGAAVLRASLDESGLMPTFLHTHWLAAGAWYRLGQRELAERGLTTLPNHLDETTPARRSRCWRQASERMAAGRARMGQPPTHMRRWRRYGRSFYAVTARYAQVARMFRK